MLERPVDPKVMMRLGIAAAANALAIVEEANLLADHGYDARAFCLSVLAVEELSKAWVANVGLHFADEAGVEPDVRQILRGHHTAKLDASLALERILSVIAGVERDEMARELDGVLSKDLYEQKNAGMYVDLEGDEVLGPERIGPDEVALGKKLRKMVVVWGIILQGGLERDLGQAP